MEYVIRIIIFVFMAEVKEKRKTHTYKLPDSIYYSAVRKAWEHNTFLANIIEKFVTKYANSKPKKKAA